MDNIGYRGLQRLEAPKPLRRGTTTG